MDLRRLKEGVVETETFGMLPEAEVAFLDEIFQGSTAILNTLLGVLNERVFRRGHTRMTCPLRVCVGASNALPEDDALAAFADRFLLRAFVEPVPDPMLERLLEGGWSLGQEAAGRSASIGDIDTLAEAARVADMSGVRPALGKAIRILRGAGITLTDRRAVKAQRLIAAAAVLAGRERPTEADLWPVVFVVPTHEQQALARDCLRELLSSTENGALPAAAEEASRGPLARAARIAQAAREILDERPAAGDPSAARSWRLRLEGVAREIDAGFTPEQMPQELVEVRVHIIDLLGQTDGRQ